MDGNGRWANARGLRRNAGHEAGEEALFRSVEGALELGVRDLTVYAVSTENWRRSPEEVRFLLEFNRSLLLRRVDELIDRDVRVRFIGRRARPVPGRLNALVERTEGRAAHCPRVTPRIAFNYGSRSEHGDAARRAAEDVASGALRRIDARSLAASRVAAAATAAAARAAPLRCSSSETLPIRIPSPALGSPSRLRAAARSPGA